jgi:hypothetical protein
MPIEPLNQPELGRKIKRDLFNLGTFWGLIIALLVIVIACCIYLYKAGDNAKQMCNSVTTCVNLTF